AGLGRGGRFALEVVGHGGLYIQCQAWVSDTFDAPVFDYLQDGEIVAGRLGSFCLFLRIVDLTITTSVA
ncbi:hypothetical protein, partial [Polaromonas sp. AET17H-212]|uniref:hypothetical protein n=1 Tax=Polaromonas sp. AET17H-212 TaxID=1977061 RepID=UPI001C3EE858